LRRGQIMQGQDMRDNANVVNAMVPFANMFGYVNALRSLSRGRATFTMQFDHYAPVPRPEDDPPFRHGVDSVYRSGAPEDPQMKIPNPQMRAEWTTRHAQGRRQRRHGAVRRAEFTPLCTVSATRNCLKFARPEARALVTLDRDFGQVTRFPPEKSAGIIVLDVGPGTTLDGIIGRPQDFPDRP